MISWEARTDQCPCEASLYYFGKVVVTMGFLRTGRKQSLLFFALGGKKKNLGNYRLSSLPLIPGKVLKQFQENISRYMKDKKVIGNSQHEFMQMKSCLANLVASYDEMPGLEDKG